MREACRNVSPRDANLIVAFKLFCKLSDDFLCELRFHASLHAGHRATGAYQTLMPEYCLIADNHGALRLEFHTSVDMNRYSKISLHISWSDSVWDEMAGT